MARRRTKSPYLLLSRRKRKLKTALCLVCRRRVRKRGLRLHMWNKHKRKWSKRKGRWISRRKRATTSERLTHYLEQPRGGRGRAPLGGY